MRRVSIDDIDIDIGDGSWNGAVFEVEVVLENENEAENVLGRSLKFSLYR
jgi:hypothetical protein